MRMHDKCFSYVVNQVIKVANITGVNNKEELLREVFKYLSKYLSEENKNTYFFLMTKCDVFAADINVEEKKMICMKSKVLTNN